MILRIVNFTLSGIDDEQYRRHAATVADGFNQWKGLTAKIWLNDPDTGTYGGAYLFVDQQQPTRLAPPTCSGTWRAARPSLTSRCGSTR